MDRQSTFFLFTSAKNRKRKHMSQLVQLRLYSRAQYALCGCQHSQAPNSKQRSFLCKSLGWQAGGLLCVTWRAFGKVVFDLFSSNVCAPLPSPSKPPLRFVEGPIPGAPAFRTSCIPSNAMRCPKRSPLLGLMQHIGYVRLQLGGEH